MRLAQLSRGIVLSAFVLGSALGPAHAYRMNARNAALGCDSLVTQAHPNLKGKEHGAEVRKCKADPDAYNKASGF